MWLRLSLVRDVRTIIWVTTVVVVVVHKFTLARVSAPRKEKEKKGKTSKHTNYNVGRYDISDGPVMPHNYDVYYSQLLYTRIMYLRNNTHYNTLYTYIQSSGV